LTSALLIAQIRNVKQAGGAAVLLIDELAAELDEANRRKLMAMIRSLDIQTFVTAVDPGSVPVSGWTEVRQFHVKQGFVQEVL
jgi:DNA replication and repair protein RecF